METCGVTHADPSVFEFSRGFSPALPLVPTDECLSSDAPFVWSLLDPFPKLLDPVPSLTPAMLAPLSLQVILSMEYAPSTPSQGSQLQMDVHPLKIWA